MPMIVILSEAKETKEGISRSLGDWKAAAPCKEQHETQTVSRV